MTRKQLHSRLMTANAEYLRGYNHASCRPPVPAEPVAATGAQAFYEEGYNDGAGGKRRGLEKEPANYVGHPPIKEPNERDEDHAKRVQETAEAREYDRVILTFFRRGVASAAGGVQAVMSTVGEATQKQLDFFKEETVDNLLSGVEPARIAGE